MTDYRLADALQDTLREAIASEMSMMWDDYVARGGVVHKPDLCKGEACVVHNPSEHKMRGWPRILRSSALIERQCEHGVGHPDPDSVAWMNLTTKQNSWGIHGCDGCCA